MKGARERKEREEGREPAMTNSISGTFRISARKPVRRQTPISEEEAAHRQLVRDVMSRVDFKEVKPSMAFGRRRWDDAFVAQGTGGPRPGVYIPASGERLTCINSTLLAFKASEKDGTMRMKQIDQWLSELGNGRAGTDGKDKEQGSAELLDIGKVAKNTYRSTKFSNANSQLTIDATNLTKALVSGSLALKSPEFGSHAPGDTKSLLEAICFYKNSIEELISTGLADKIQEAEAKLVAIELGKLINGYAYNYGSTVEERAKNREIGSRLAEHFARVHFSAPGEAQLFLEKVYGYVEIDEMQEKGYDFWEGEAYESYKPHPLSIVWKRWERGGARPYSQESVDAFHENERKVTETIAKAKAKVSNDDVSRKLEQIHEVFGIIKDTVEDDDEARSNVRLIGDLNMLWVWYGTDL